MLEKNSIVYNNKTPTKVAGQIRTIGAAAESKGRTDHSVYLPQNDHRGSQRWSVVVFFNQEVALEIPMLVGILLDFCESVTVKS